MAAKKSAKGGGAKKKPAKKPAKKAAAEADAPDEDAASAKSPGKPAARKAGAAKKTAAKPTARKSKAKAAGAGATKKVAAAKAKPKDAPKARDADAEPEELEAEASEGGEEAPAEEKKVRPIPSMPKRRSDGVITIALSPDADDAFMLYALQAEKVDTEGRKYELVRDEIQVLNEKARKGEHDVTAISFGAYPHIADRYALLSCGASFGDGRGPILVARTPVRTSEVNGLTVAVPGLMTTAALALRMWLPHAKLKLVEVPFDQVVAAVQAEKTRAGVLIHEQQLTWREENLVRVVDFGQWWGEKTEGLPLPLGANAIRRDIPEEERAKIALDIKRSIAYGLGHREETLEYALTFAKGLPKETVDKYVSMYVNELALDYAERGRQAVRQFLAEAHRWGFIPDVGDPEFV